MPFIDVLGILVFCLSTYIIYKKAWFYSFYSFVKFLVVFFLSLIIGLFISSHISYTLPITPLEQALLIQLVLFVVFWKLLSFKHVFFATTRKVFNLDHFLFVHHIDPILNVFPSAVAAFFLTFSLFTVLVSQGASNPTLQSEITRSKIIKPIAYVIYFSSFGSPNLSIFNGTLFKSIPSAYSSTGQSLNSMKDSAILSFRQKLDIQRLKAGLFTVPYHLPSGEVEPYYPPNEQTTPDTIPTAAPEEYHSGAIPYVPAQRPTDTPTPVPNTPIPEPTHGFFEFPTAAPTPYPTPVPNTQPPSAPQEPQQPLNISQVEQDIFNLTNEQRRQNGVSPLTFNNDIAAVARAHSVDMNTRNFFDHVNPDGLDPFQRLRIGGISSRAAGENIAGAPTAEMIVNNWMHSPGHRANILNPAFKQIGIGVSPSSKYGLFATQDFTD